MKQIQSSLNRDMIQFNSNPSVWRERLVRVTALLPRLEGEYDLTREVWYNVLGNAVFDDTRL